MYHGPMYVPGCMDQGVWTGKIKKHYFGLVDEKRQNDVRVATSGEGGGDVQGRWFLKVKLRNSLLIIGT